jgi:hypothetical protein
VTLAALDVEIYRSPVGDGYIAVTRAARSDRLTIEAMPGVAIPVGGIFEYLSADLPHAARPGGLAVEIPSYFSGHLTPCHNGGEKNA